MNNQIKLSELSLEQSTNMFPFNPILVGYIGSISHGTYEKDVTDDEDIMGVSIGNEEHYIGLNSFEHKRTQEGKWDVIVYELKKYIQLLLKSNPNVLCLLWLPEKYRIFTNKEGRELINNRDIFVSKNIYHSFTGYAYGQLHRMTHFGENRFKTAYMGKKRKELVEKFGYDTKNASHLIRLLQQGIEFLNEGELYVERENASQLLEIKHGEWKLERVLEESKRLFDLAQVSYVQSKLPNKPDFKRADELCVKLIRSKLYENESK
jgi:predicted nucleotidyltransferase